LPPRRKERPGSRAAGLQEELLDPGLAVREAVAEKGQVGAKAVLGRHGMVGLGSRAL
jgi:hypothetical protein